MGRGAQKNLHSEGIGFLLRDMSLSENEATGATWIGASVKSQKPLSGEELARSLNEAILLNAEQGLKPISIQPVQSHMRPGIVTNGFVVVWGPKSS